MSLADKQAEFLARNEAESVANAMPMPGPSGEAFAVADICVAGFCVRPVVQYDWRIWQRTNNALVRSLQELDKPEGERGEINDDGDEAVIAWMLTHTPAQCDTVLKQGIAAFKSTCMSETEMKMPMHIFGDILKACMDQVAKSCAAAVKYSADKEAESKTTFFQGSEVKPLTA